MKDELYAYVGTYTRPIRFGTDEVLDGRGEGIYVFRVNPSSGALEPCDIMKEVVNPSFLALNPEKCFLYAVNETKEYKGEPTGTVSSFSVDPEEGEFEPLNERPTRGADPCHVTVDKTGSYVFVANFGNGSVSVYPVMEDGSLGEFAEFVQHQGSGAEPSRQEGPHAHSVTLNQTNRYAYVSDLGVDKVMIYRFDPKNGKLRPKDGQHFEAKPGAGPRHFKFHPNNRYAYLINELDSTLVAFSYDEENGALTEIQTVSTLPEDFKGKSTCAEVQVSPSGRYVYGSNRGHDSIVIYRFDPRTGELSYVAHESSQGKTPRHFSIDPTARFLLVANQDSNTIVTFRVDQKSGELEDTGQVTDVPTPTCVKITRV